MPRLLPVLGLFLLCALAPAAQAVTPVPPHDAPVIDQTGVLEATTVNELQLRLAEYRQETGTDIAVLLVPTTQPESLDAYGERVLRAWRLAGRRDRAALLLWSAQGEIAMVVSPGLEEALPVSMRVDIFRNWVIPRFADGNADLGIRDGVERTIAVLQGEAVGEPAAPEAAAQAQATEPTTEEGDASLDEAATVADEPAPALEANAPAWLAAALAELRQLADGVEAQPYATLDDLVTRAGAQLQRLPSRMSAVLRGESPESAPPMLLARAATVGLGLLVAWTVAALARGALASALLRFGLIGAPLLWLASGFTALAVMLPLVALLACLAWPLLRALAHSLDQRPRIPDSGSASAGQRLLEAQRQAQAEWTARMRQGRALARPTAATTTPLPTPTLPSPQPPAATRPGSASRADGQAVAAAVRRIKTWQLVLAVVLLAIHPVLGVIAFVFLAWRVGIGFRGLAGGQASSALQQVLAQLKAAQARAQAQSRARR